MKIYYFFLFLCGWARILYSGFEVGVGLELLLPVLGLALELEGEAVLLLLLDGVVVDAVVLLVVLLR